MIYLKLNCKTTTNDPNWKPDVKKARKTKVIKSLWLLLNEVRWRDSLSLDERKVQTVTEDSGPTGWTGSKWMSRYSDIVTHSQLTFIPFKRLHIVPLLWSVCRDDQNIRVNPPPLWIVFECNYHFPHRMLSPNFNNAAEVCWAKDSAG